MSEELMDVDQANELIAQRPNSIWLNGVDNLSTNDVKSYIRKISSDDFKVEWINDSSLNVVFEEQSHASEALKKLTKDQETQYEDTQEREAVLMDDSKPDLTFTIRISNSNDKKVKNASQYSRYYLFHPKEDKSLKKVKAHGYRERDHEMKRTRRRQPDDDSTDLFPEKLNSSIRHDESMGDAISTGTNVTSLSSRMGSAGDNTASSLLDRLGSKFKSKQLDDDDLFSK